MTLRLVSLLGLLLLAACGEAQPRPNEAPSRIYRRHSVPFAERLPEPDEAQVASSDEVDALERLYAEGRDGECRTRLAAYFAGGGNHPRVHDLHGRLLVLEGRNAEAAEAFSRAVALSPRWLRPRLNLADCYVDLDRPAAAESVYAEIDRLMPDAPWGPWGMGVLAARTGASERAITLIDEALRRDPRCAPALRIRAALAGQSGDRTLECAYLERYLGEEPAAIEAHQRLGELAEADGRLVDAERHFSDAYTLRPDNRLAKHLAELATRRGDDETAAKWHAIAAP